MVTGQKNTQIKGVVIIAKLPNEEKSKLPSIIAKINWNIMLKMNKITVLISLLFVG
jgi:hypothetical protein